MNVATITIGSTRAHGIGKPQVTMDLGDTIVSAEGIHREFRTGDAVLSVLTGLTLRAGKGETVAITGASGVGKSTLLHILGGLDRPTRGQVTIKGVPLNRRSDRELAEFRNHEVGFVFQHHFLLDDFDALENVMIPMLVAGKSRREASRKAELLLDQVGLNYRKQHRPRQLSGGESQRVAVARALANEPEVVLADEPSGDLDTGTGRRLQDLLFRLNSEHGTTFIIATHDRELAARCCRELAIVDGRAQEASREAKNGEV